MWTRARQAFNGHHRSAGKHPLMIKPNQVKCNVSASCKLRAGGISLSENQPKHVPVLLSSYEVPQILACLCGAGSASLTESQSRQGRAAKRKAPVALSGPPQAGAGRPSGASNAFAAPGAKRSKPQSAASKHGQKSISSFFGGEGHLICSWHHLLGPHVCHHCLLAARLNTKPIATHEGGPLQPLNT